MKDEEKMNEKLERYLSGEMSTEERARFEEHLEDSDALQELLELHSRVDDFQDDDTWFSAEGNTEAIKEASQLFRGPEVEAFSDKLKVFRGDNQQPDIGKGVSWTKIVVAIGVAACFVIALILFTPKTNDFAQLYEEYSSWNELPSLTVKSGSGQGELAELEQWFREGKFERVVSETKNILSDSGTNTANLMLYQGVSLLELDRDEEALMVFSDLTKSNTIDHHKGYWYMAMVHLKSGDEPALLRVLEQIASEPTYFRNKEATALLQKLK